MIKPRKVEIKEESKILKDLRRKLPGSYQESVDAQVSVLETNMSEDEIDDVAAVEEWPDEVLAAAMQARNWMDGEVDDPPSVEWEDLLEQEQ